jgi:hypothetical protein
MHDRKNIALSRTEEIKRWIHLSRELAGEEARWKANMSGKPQGQEVDFVQAAVG